MEIVRTSFLDSYLKYVGDTEAPTFYHRWAAISMVGAYLGRQYSFQHGHFELYTNMYVMLIGDPGTRKSTAIKIAKKILIAAGYVFISSDRTTKEKFLIDLSGNDETEQSKTVDSILNENLWGDMEDTVSESEMYIACDEFNDFVGLGNLQFISLLGTLWDYNGVFKDRIKNGKSVSIPNPTVSILGGNTSVSFNNAFPADILGQGFFSRLLLIHGETTDRKITFPQLPSAEDTAFIVSSLQRIKLSVKGIAVLSEQAKLLLDKIYKTTPPLEDVRFISFYNRRFTHLLKLCLIISACHYSNTIEVCHVVEANTLLTHTEALMPKALGAFGRSRNSEITHKILSILGNAIMPMSMKDMWPLLIADLDKVEDLAEQLRNLMLADLIQAVEGKYLSKKKITRHVNSDMLDYGYLTKEELDLS